MRPTPAWSRVGTIWDYTGSLSTVPRVGCAPPRHGPTFALYGPTQGHCLQYPGRVAPHPGMVPRWHYMGLHRVTVFSTQGGLRPTPAWFHAGTIWEYTGSLSTVPRVGCAPPGMVPRGTIQDPSHITGFFSYLKMYNFNSIDRWFIVEGNRSQSTWQRALQNLFNFFIKHVSFG